MYAFYALYLGTFAIVATVVYLICGRIIARFLEWVARRLFKVEIQVGRAQFLALGGIKITTAGTKIEIENIVLHTKWGFPGSRRFLMLCFGHITVTAAKNAGEKESKGFKESQSKPGNGNNVSKNKRLAGLIKFISKYMGVYLHSLDVILINQPRTKFNIITQVVKSVKILCQPNERFLDFSVQAKKIVSRLHKVKEVETDYFQDITLAEVSFNFLVEGSLNPVMSEQLLENLSIKVNPIRISLGENFIKNLTQLRETNKKLPSLTAIEEESKCTEFWFSKYLPKNFDLIFTEVDLCICDEEQRELSILMKNLSFTASLQDQSLWMIESMALLLNGLKIKTKRDLMSFSKFMLTIKTQKSESRVPCLWSKVYLASCQCDYVHEEISHWVAFFSLGKRGNSEKKSLFTPITELTKKCSFENNLEIDDITVCVTEELLKGVDKPVCKAVLASLVTNIQLPAQDQQHINETVNCSARLENAYVYFNGADIGISLQDDPTVLPNSRKHLWGRVLELGSSSIKCDITLEDSIPSKMTMKCDASSFVAEYSQHTKKCLATLLRTGGLYKRLQTRKSANEIKQSPKSIVSLECDVTVHDINVFCVGKCEDGMDSVLARLDVVSLTKGEDDVQIGAHGFKITKLTEVKKEAYGCANSSDLCDSLLTVSTAVTYLSSKGTTLSLPKIKVDWDVASHMAVHDRISGIINDSKELKAILANPASKDAGITSTGDIISNIQLEITTADVAVEMKTSSVNSFGVEFSGVIKLEQGWISAELPNVDILFDQKTIIQFKALSLKKTASNSHVSAARSMIEGFESSTNKIWLLDAEFCVLFPYGFNFGKSLDKLLIVNKMLKQLYRKPKIGIKDPLYADVWLNLKKLSFEIEDDPFEVKLGKNYELLCDEALEWAERERLLEEKISEKRKNPGNMLSDKRVEGLYYSLSENKSKIYIERSVKLYEADKRTRLCCWEFADVNLMILADESMNGPDKVVPAIKRIDNESPFPSEEIQFSTLWCRFVKGTVSSSTFTLRDYEQPLFLCESFEISGHLIGAEQAPYERAKRTCVVDIPQPWGEQQVTRGMTPLKYFHDLTFDFEKLEMSWGVDIEPAYTMVNIAFEHINKASVDPSVGLPFWDKDTTYTGLPRLRHLFQMRLLLHGRLLMNIKEWQLKWRATRNPYDKSEQLVIEWRNVRFDWTNACFDIFGDFDLFTRTASKYDDCCVLHLPALKFKADLVWHCRDEGDANNHYNIRPCAPDKLPELPPGQVHDSYAAFRSQNLSLNVSFEVDAKRLKEEDVPTILLYASTFRWFQNFQAVVWRNVSRPIKKGSIFNRILPKRKPLSRHYRNVGLNLKFPQLSLFYWGSFTKHLGAELNLGTGSLNTIYRVGLSEYKDGLIRRPAATWTIIKLDSEIDDVTCYVTGVEEKEPEKETGQPSTPSQESPESDDEISEPQAVETSKFYLGHVDRLVYKRKEISSFQEQSEVDGAMSNEDYTHNLVCHNFRGVWTLTNRKLSFGLVETYTRSQQLKRDLSTDALKFVKVDDKNTSALAESSPDVTTRRESSTRRLSTSQTKLDDLFTKTLSGKVETGDDVDSPMPASRPRSTTGDILLDKLVSESADSSKFYVQTEEGTSDEAQSSGYALCNSEDVHEQRWHFEFINSQVMLNGIENSGCLLVSAGHAEVLNRLHRPTKSGRKLLNKKSWVGHLENMQYFCTVGGNEDLANTDKLWLDSNTIQARRKNTGLDLTDLTSVLGSGDSIGSFVGDMVVTSTKLQRIVSRCGCEFYYASFDDELEEGLEAVPASNTPAPSPASKLRDNQSAGDPVNTFTLRHPVLEICINSAQYALILDIVSNVLLYTEPQKKEVSELEQRMGFYFQLSTAEDLKGTILNVQNNVRGCLMGLNELRRMLYNLNEIMKKKDKVETPDENCLEEIQELYFKKQQLESDATEMKANLNELSTELRIMISAYKDFMTDRVLLSPEKARSGDLMRVVEVFLNHVSWKLTQPDGQLHFVNAELMNLRYTNITKTNASGVHSVEIGNFNMTNLMPNSPYKNVITPSGERRVGKDIAVRVYCRVKSPVGGIGVKDHFEVNLCPLNVALTHRLYRLMMGYFFPGRKHEDARESVEEYDGAVHGAVDQQPQSDKEVFHEESLSQKPSRPNSLAISDGSLNDPLRSRMSTSSLDTISTLPSPLGSDKKSGRSRFYANLSETASRELDKMKERAAQTNNFVYVKIPEIPICFSYKGEKEKNLVDVHNFRLTLPTLQYQNRTWTWLDLMMAVKKDYKQVLVGQVIKEKLHWKAGENKETKESVYTQDKAKILFGERQSGGRKKKKKSLLSKFGLKHKSDKTDSVSFSGVAVGDQASFGLEDERFEPRSSDEEESSGVVD